MSPALFNVYMNNLSASPNQSGIDGSLEDNLVKHTCICYADDLRLIAHSSSEMQHLFDLCNVYDTNHRVSYNTAKLPNFALGVKVNS